MIDFKIVLDSGHGQYGNPGVVEKYYEGTQMYKLTQYQKEELEKYQGVEVIVTRKTIIDNPSLAARGNTAKNADLLISNHSNSPGQIAKDNGTFNDVKGTTIYDSVAKPNKALANKLGETVANIFGHKFRGITYKEGSNGDYFGVIRNAIKANCKNAIIIEHGFHTNKDDCTFLLSDENLKKIAKAEVEVIAKHYNLKLKVIPTTPKVEDGNVYIIKPKDSLWKIAQANKTTVEALAKLNNIKDPGKIYPGQKIILQVAEKPKTDTPAATTPVTPTTPISPKPTLQIGSKVKVTGSKYATGQVIPAWVKQKNYTVQQIKGDRVLLKEIVSWVYTKDITLL